MAKLQIKPEILESARDRAILTEGEESDAESIVCQGGLSKGSITAETARLPLALLDDTRRSPGQRASVAIRRTAPMRNA